MCSGVSNGAASVGNLVVQHGVCPEAEQDLLTEAVGTYFSL